MDEKQTESILLFYFLAFLDDRRALEASQKAVLKLKKFSQVTDADLVQACFVVWQKFGKKVSRGHPNYSAQFGWMIPDSMDMGPWKEFQKLASEEVLLATIWSQALRFSDQDIASGLRVSVGTVRYRVSNGLKLLGSVSQIGRRVLGAHPS